MYLIVGLGNPGKKYENTRHNAGAMALDALAKHWRCGEWRLDKKFSSLLTECLKPGFKQPKPLVLAKPQTFMNNSGKAVKSLTTSYKLPFDPELRIEGQATNLVVVHDDIDIPLGKVKISENRGSAGHKGIESIIQALGTKNFTRVRIGIQPAKGKSKNVESFVLKPFQKTELPLLKPAIEQATTILASLMKLRIP